MRPHEMFCQTHAGATLMPANRNGITALKSQYYPPPEFASETLLHAKPTYIRSKSERNQRNEGDRAPRHERALPHAYAQARTRRRTHTQTSGRGNSLPPHLARRHAHRRFAFMLLYRSGFRRGWKRRCAPSVASSGDLIHELSANDCRAAT